MTEFNDLPDYLFSNIDKGWELSIVCIDHKSFIPCRKCLYGTVAKTPYSHKSEDINAVSDYQRGGID